MGSAYLAISIILTILAACLSLTILANVTDEWRGDSEDWIVVCVAVFAPVIAWLWPVILGLLVVGIVLAIPVFMVYAPYRAYKAWREEG